MEDFDSAVQALNHQRLLYQAAELFTRAGVKFIVIKGVSMAVGTYAEGHGRPTSDLDILIDPPDFEKCRGALELAGYSMESALKRGVMLDRGRECLFRTSRGEEMDVHYRFFQWHREKYLYKIDSREFFRRACAREWKGFEIHALTPEDEFYYSLMCIFENNFRAFRYYLDADAIARRHGGGMDWERVRGYLATSPLRRYWARILDFLVDRLKTPIPDRSLESISEPRGGAAPGAAWIGRRLFSSPDPLRDKYFNFFAARGAADKMRLLKVGLQWRLFESAGLFRGYFMRRNNPVPAYFIDTPS